MVGRIFFGVVMSMLLAPLTATASWQVGGVAVSANDVFGQMIQAVPDGSGGCVVVWWTDNVPAGIYAQRINYDAAVQWQTGGVNISNHLPDAVMPGIVPNHDGWLVTWVDKRSGTADLYAAKIDLNGVCTPPQLLLSDISDALVVNNHLCRVNGNDAILAFDEYEAGLSSVHALYIYDNLTVVDIGPLTGYPSNARNPHVVPDGSTGAIVVWDHSPYANNDWEVYAQRVNSGGTVWTQPKSIINGWYSLDGRSHVISDGLGGAVVTFAHDDYMFIVQRIDANGNTYMDDPPGKKGAVLETVGIQYKTNPSLALDDAGDFVIVFEGGSSYTDTEIYAERIDVGTSAGLNVLYGPVLVENPGGSGRSYVPVIANNAFGGTVVIWRVDNLQFSHQIYAQRLDELGVRFWENDVMIYQSNDAACPEPEMALVEQLLGGAYVAWFSYDFGGNQSGVYANRLVGLSEPVAQMSQDLGCTGNSHFWNVTLSFDLECSVSQALVEHGPIDCGRQCTYNRIAQPEIGQISYSVPLDDEIAENDNLNPKLDPVSEYCYVLRSSPGGLPVFEGSLVLQPDCTYPLYIGAEQGASITIDEDCDFINWYCFEYEENGVIYPGRMAADSCHTDSISFPAFSPNPRNGERSLKFEANSVVDPCTTYYDTNSCGTYIGTTMREVKQRSRLDFVFDIPFFEERFEAFSIMIDPQTTLPDKWSGLMNWFQDNDLCQAPMELDLTQLNGTLYAELFVKNEDHCGVYGPGCTWHGPKGDGSKRVHQFPLPLGEWVDIIIGYTFDPYGGSDEPSHCGYVTIWVNGDGVTYEGKVGFPEPWEPDSNDEGDDPDFSYNSVSQFIALHPLGIYRGVPTGSKLIVYFDEIRHGLTKEDVDFPPIGIDPIHDIVSSFDAENCEVDVEWKVWFHSTNNRLKYRHTGTTNWTTVNAVEDNSEPVRRYKASFIQTQRTEFKVETEIYGVVYESATMEQSGRCDDGRPPRPGLTETKTTVIKPFLRSHPNPFNPSTTISYGVPSTCHVELEIYNADGRRVSTLWSGNREKGIYKVVWNGTNGRGTKVSSGIYFVRLMIGQTKFTSKIVLLK